MMAGDFYAVGAEAPLVIEIPHGTEVNQLIGTRGANINQLQAETGTHIAIQKAADVPPGVYVRKVTISGGDIGQRQHCASRIFAQVHEFAQLNASASSTAANLNAGPGPPNVGSCVIEIPNGPEVNFVIGRSGSTINALQAETCTHIAVQRAHEVPAGATVRLVTISGNEAQRMRCIALIRAKVLEYQSSVGQLAANMQAAAPTAEANGGEDAGDLVIEIPNGLAVNHVIGARGATINGLQQETGTHISIQRASEVPEGAVGRLITISGGNTQARERCATLIQNKVNPVTLGIEVGHLRHTLNQANPMHAFDR